MSARPGHFAVFLGLKRRSRTRAQSVLNYCEQRVSIAIGFRPPFEISPRGLAAGLYR